MEEKELILSPAIAAQMSADSQYEKRILKFIVRYLRHDYGNVTPLRMKMNDMILGIVRKYPLGISLDPDDVCSFDPSFAKYEDANIPGGLALWVFEETSAARSNPKIWVMKPEEYYDWFVLTHDGKEIA